MRSPMRRSAAAVKSELSPSAGKEPVGTLRGTLACGMAAGAVAASVRAITARQAKVEATKGRR